MAKVPALFMASAVFVGSGVLGLSASTAAVTTSQWNSNLGSGLSDIGVAIAVQSDGKVLVGGEFGAFNEDGGINHLVRLNTDGTLDTTFIANIGTGFNNSVEAIAVQPDGKILVGGVFSSVNGATDPSGLVRLNADGTPDNAGFNNALGSGFDMGVTALATTLDGDILVGGNFTSLDTTDVPDRLVRINSDGTIDSDTSFNTNLGTGFDSTIYSIATDHSDFIVVGGDFQTLNGSGAIPKRLLHLNGSGVSATTFNTNLGTGFDSSVYSIALRSDNSLYVGGAFTQLNADVGTPDKLVRLTASGAIDSAFATALGLGMSGGDVFAVAVRPDGGVFAAGEFTGWAGSAGPMGLVAFRADGGWCTDFNSHLGVGIASGDYLYAVAARGDDDAIITGNFTSFGNYSGSVGYLLRVKTPVAPTKPRNIQSVAGNSSARVTWTMPSFDGGRPITSVNVNINPSGNCTVDSWNSVSGSATCTGLDNGMRYTVIVSANNSVGVGTSGYVNVRPYTTPGKVSQFAKSFPGPGKARITWRAPETNGAKIKRYEYCLTACQRGMNWYATALNTIPAMGLSGLVKGAVYSVRVRAVNAAGHGSVAIFAFRQFK
jgi:uncharacterized delta-60 repeat protein